MRTFNPRQVVSEIKAAQIAALCRVRRVADGHVGAIDPDLRQTDANATGANGLISKQIAIAPIGVIKTQVINQRRLDDRGKSDQSLNRFVGVLQPVRR